MIIQSVALRTPSRRLTNEVEMADFVFDGGWIVKQLQLKPPQPGEVQSIHLIVEDSSGKRVEQVVPVRRGAQD